MKFQVGVLALSFFLETKHNSSQCFTCTSENLTHNSSYSWPLEYFQAYDQKWHQALESALLASLYANFCWWQCLHFLHRRALVMSNLCYFILFARNILWNTAAIKTAKLLGAKKSHEQYIHREILFFSVNSFSKTFGVYRAQMFRDHCCYKVTFISVERKPFI